MNKAEKTRTLVIGAGISGLACADHLADHDYLVCEADDEVGGYCKTVRRDGFIWDYSGHFFHFRHPEIERELLARMQGQRVLQVKKESRILYGDRWIDFPFQKNIHQLPKQEFIDCLVDLFCREDKVSFANFHEMLIGKFGRGIADKFLIPYNEKLYATDLKTLDVDAMGRFFPYADLQEIVRNFRVADNSSYNATFTYPEGGAVQYVQALMSGVDSDRLRLRHRIRSIDLRRRIASTDHGSIAFERAVSSAPLPELLQICQLPYDPAVYSCNKVLVFNLGFDRKGPRGVHWVYLPQRDLPFYRVGFYDNIFDSERMSLYVEVGYPQQTQLDRSAIDAMREQVLQGLRRCGIISDQRLVAHHDVVLDPAYVHITSASNADVAAQKQLLAACGIYSIGRYGSWTYCSIEDNIVEARALARVFNRLPT